MGPSYTAVVHVHEIEITATPAIRDVAALGDVDVEVVRTIPLDPDNRSIPDYVRLLTANGWTVIGDWGWLKTRHGRCLYAHIRRS